ncbi:MAG: hypothetical protein KJ655_03320 [Candidatus Thermoplasmatota archaeon]|nr:hypothetical protein [Candidatus Thermoplasmatota archaeon]
MMNAVRFIREKLGGYGIGAIVFFLLSLYSSLLGTLPGTILWILFGALALACIYAAFHSVWRYGLWLIGIYVFSGAGGYLLTHHDSVRLVGGMICEIIGVFILLSLIYRVIDMRKKTKHKHPLGLWFLSLLIFFVFANLSLSDWSYWLMDKTPLYIYTFSEIVIICSGVYVLWFLQEKISARNVCPVCDCELRVDKRSCPSCDGTESFFWCKKGEHHIIKCPSCNKLTLHGKKCIHCGRKLKKRVECRSCGSEHPLAEWIRL